MKSRTIVSILTVGLTCLSTVAAVAAPPDGAPPPVRDPLGNLFSLFGEVSGGLLEPVKKLPGGDRSADNARRALCDEQVRVFFDFWAPLIFDEEMKPLREQLAGLSFAPDASQERKRIFYSLSASMSALTAKLLIIQTYRGQLEARCANSTQRDEVIQALTNLMLLVDPPNRHTLDEIIAGLAQLTQGDARPFSQGPAPRKR
jgi:hypothetical protein